MRKAILQRVRNAQGLAENRGLLDRVLIRAYGFYRRFWQTIKSVDNEKVSKSYLRARSLKRNLTGKNFKFVNVDQATIWTMEWVRTFPRRYDLIVGVPRSGMFIASLIALKLGKGLTTPELLQQGKYWHSGQVKDKLPLDGTNHILLVDDSMDTGRAMSRAVEQIRTVNSEIQISRACLVVRKEATTEVDFFHKVIAPPRAFEWNLLHRKIASYWGNGYLAVDMDGVLCEDCPPGVDDDEMAYLKWIAEARPFLIPAFEIDAIVTCRLEKYRRETEDWLQRHDVRYKELYMWDVPAKSERRGRFARQKIDQLLRIKPDMFWESNWDQSQRIWNETRVPTLCVDNMTLLN